MIDQFGRLLRTLFSTKSVRGEVSRERLVIAARENAKASNQLLTAIEDFLAENDRATGRHRDVGKPATK